MADSEAPRAYALGGTRGVLAAAVAWRKAGRDLAVVFVVESEGSTYRKPGAVAVVADDGARRGTLSGGCLEPAIDALALHAMQARSRRSAEFDTRDEDDLVYGSGSGCRGRTRVIAVPVRAGVEVPLFDAVTAASDSGAALRIALPLDDDCAFDGWVGVMTPRGMRFEPAKSGRAITQELCGGRHRIPLTGDEVELVVFELRPTPHLLLIGSGPEAAPLLSYARGMGWFTALIDHREVLLLENARLADRASRGRPLAAFQALDGVRFDAALVMTHVASADLEALQMMAFQDIAYVGLLGPRTRRDELFAQLDPSARAALDRRLHAPVGLDLGGEGPEAIALSIVADLQRHFSLHR